MVVNTAKKYTQNKLTILLDADEGEKRGLFN